MKKDHKIRSPPEQELTDAYNKTLNWFFSYPTREISLSDLAKQLQISKTTANRIVTQLTQEGFLIQKSLGKLWQISCNQKHTYNITKKIGHNLTRIYESGILEEIHKIIPSSRAIILFGSYRKGDDIDTSDIDIAVETLNNKDLIIHPLGILQQFSYRKNIPVNVHIFSRNKIDLNLFTNIANGILLEGLLEVRP